MSATLAARARTGASVSAPVRRPAAASPGRRKASLAARLLRGMGRRPGKALFYLLFTAVAAAIIVNALLFQEARRPLPPRAPAASGTTAPAPQPAPAARAEAPAAAPVQSAPVQPQPSQQSVLPPARPGEFAPAAREAAPRPPAAVTPAATRAAAPAPAPVAARPAPARDPIADLINGDLRPPADIRNTRAAPPRRATVEN